MNRSRSVPLLALAAALWLAACAPQPRTTPAPASEPGLSATLTSLLVESADAWNRGDLEGFLATYADTAVFMGASGPIRGMDEIRERYRRTYFATGRPDQELRFDSIEVQPLGAGYAVQTGRFILSGGGQPEQSGWFTLIWARTPEGWRILRDHTS